MLLHSSFKPTEKWGGKTVSLQFSGTLFVNLSARPKRGGHLLGQYLIQKIGRAFEMVLGEQIFSQTRDFVWSENVGIPVQAKAISVLVANSNRSCHMAAHLAVFYPSIMHSIHFLKSVRTGGGEISNPKCRVARSKSQVCVFPNANLIINVPPSRTSKQTFERLVDVNNLAVNPTANASSVGVTRDEAFIHSPRFNIIVTVDVFIRSKCWVSGQSRSDLF